MLLLLILQQLPILIPIKAEAFQWLMKCVIEPSPLFCLTFYPLNMRYFPQSNWTPCWSQAHWASSGIMASAFAFPSGPSIRNPMAHSLTKPSHFNIICSLYTLTNPLAHSPCALLHFPLWPLSISLSDLRSNSHVFHSYWLSLPECGILGLMTYWCFSSALWHVTQGRHSLHICWMN